MSVKEFCALLHQARVSKDDKKWFPSWLRRYAQSADMVDGKLLVTTAHVIRFSRSLRDNGTRAWQRLQAVRAVESYRDLVLKTKHPSLVDIRRKLGRIAAEEDSAARWSDEDQQRLAPTDPVTGLDAAEPAHLQSMRGELRVRRKALETERAYLGWVRRFMAHCGSEALELFGETEIKSFLTHLAVHGNVSAGTQNQAKSALLFFAEFSV